MEKLLSSRENETIKYACKIGQNKAFRQSEQRFLAEGLKLCLDLATTCQVHTVFYTQRALQARPEIANLGGVHYEITDSVAQKLSDTKAPQGLFVLFVLPSFCADALQAGTRWLCMEQVQDPSNVGAMLRSAAAFGFDGAILSKGTADPFSQKGVRSSMGAIGRLHVWSEVDMPDAVAQLRTKGICVYAAALQQSVPLEQVVPPKDGGIAVLIGNEGQGLTEASMHAANIIVRIPMTNNVESLNAAVAGSVLLWHFKGV